MAINVYVTSTQNFSGKSAICVALMRRLKRDGFRVGYMKPFSSAARVLAETNLDEDACFIKELFELAEPLETLAPVVLTNQQLRKILAEGGADYRGKVKEAALVVGENKDIVVMEGSANFREGYIVNLSPAQTSAAVEARVITVVGYQDSRQVVDDVLTAQARLDDHLVGVIINAVPGNRMDYVKNQVKPLVEKQGGKVLAILPREGVLQSISIAEIVKPLDGELLCSGCRDDLVENLLVGAMSVEHALTYFRRVTNKAVIVGGDRPDIQLAALETSTRALILTGSTRPNPMIATRAEEQGVAIILSPHDTLATIEIISQLFGTSRFHQVEKIRRFEELFNQALSYSSLYGALGLQMNEAFSIFEEANFALAAG